MTTYSTENFDYINSHSFQQLAPSYGSFSQSYIESDEIGNTYIASRTISDNNLDQFIFISKLTILMDYCGLTHCLEAI